jgi:hypothetical protein
MRQAKIMPDLSQNDQDIYTQFITAYPSGAYEFTRFLVGFVLLDT